MGDGQVPVEYRAPVDKVIVNGRAIVYGVNQLAPHNLIGRVVGQVDGEEACVGLRQCFVPPPVEDVNREVQAACAIPRWKTPPAPRKGEKGCSVVVGKALDGLPELGGGGMFFPSGKCVLRDSLERVGGGRRVAAHLVQGSGFRGSGIQVGSWV